MFEATPVTPRRCGRKWRRCALPFGIDRLIMAGDRGMISSVPIDAMRGLDGIDWITALKSGAIRSGVDVADPNGRVMLSRPLLLRCSAHGEQETPDPADDRIATAGH